MVISLQVIILPTACLLSLADIVNTAHFLLCIVMSKPSSAFTTKVIKGSACIHQVYIIMHNYVTNFLNIFAISVQYFSKRKQ